MCTTQFCTVLYLCEMYNTILYCSGQVLGQQNLFLHVSTVNLEDLQYRLVYLNSIRYTLYSHETSALIGAWNCNFPLLLVNYKVPTNQPNNRRTNRQTDLGVHR